MQAAAATEVCDDIKRRGLWANGLCVDRGSKAKKPFRDAFSSPPLEASMLVETSPVAALDFANMKAGEEVPIRCEEIIQETGVNVASGKATHPQAGVNIAIGQETRPETGVNIAFGQETRPETGVNSAFGLETHSEAGVNVSFGQETHPETGVNIAFGQETHPEAGMNIAFCQETRPETGVKIAFGQETRPETGVNIPFGQESRPETGLNSAFGLETHSEAGANVAFGQETHPETGVDVVFRPKVQSPKDSKDVIIRVEVDKVAENTEKPSRIAPIIINDDNWHDLSKLEPYFREELKAFPRLDDKIILLRYRSKYGTHGMIFIFCKIFSGNTSMYVLSFAK